MRKCPLKLPLLKVRVLATFLLFHPLIPIPAGGTESSDFELVSSLGGSIDAVCVQGNVVYVGEGKHATTLHLGPEGEIAVRDRLRLDDVVWDIAVSGNVMAVAHGDVSILNIGNPESPFLLTTITTPGNAVRLALDHSRLLVADKGNGVLFYDLTTPTHPDLAATYPTPYIDAVGIRIDIAVIALTPESLDDTVKVLDISDLHNPGVIGSIRYLNPKSGMGKVEEVKPESGQEREWFGKEEPTFQRERKGDFIYPQPVLYDLKINNNVAYLGDSEYKFYLIDISAPSNPSVLGRYDVIPSNSLRVAASGNYAYLVNRPSQLEILNVQNPSSPTLEATFDLGMEEPQDVFIAPPLLYIADRGVKDFLIYDISNPITPTFAGQYTTIRSAFCMAAEYPLALACNGITGDRLVDISDPVLPVPVRSALPACCGIIKGNLLYSVDLDSKLTITDISNLTNPTVIGEILGVKYGDIVVEGTKMYIGARDPDLQIIDVTDPSRPNVLVSYDSPASTVGLVVEASTAYLASRPIGGQGVNGLQIVDCSDGSNPQVQGQYVIEGFPISLSVSGESVYLVDRENGLQVLDISDKRNPLFVSEYRTPGYFYWDILVDQSFGLLAGDFGLESLDLRDPVNVIRQSSYSALGEVKRIEESNAIILADLEDPSETFYDDAGGMALFYYTGEIPPTLTPSPTSDNPTPRVTRTPTLTPTATETPSPEPPTSTPLVPTVTTTPTTEQASADLDENGIVDAMDLLVIMREWRKQTGP